MTGAYKEKNIFWIVLVHLTIKATAVTNEEMDYSIKIWNRAIDAVCSYEGGIKFPDYDKKLYWHCMEQMKTFQQMYDTDLKPHKAEDKMAVFQYLFSSTENGPMGMVPEHYGRECCKYAEKPEEKAAMDEGSFLDDQIKNYPFKAFYYCLVNQIRKTAGEKTIQILINDRILNKGKNWKEAVVARHNLMRDRHNSGPLTLEEELNISAQKWADKLAKECNMYHTSSEVLAADMDNPMGENLAASRVHDDYYMLGVIATNNLYSEIHDYCYPDGFTKDGSQSIPPGCFLSGSKQTGHFTQVVWKHTKKVGVGIGCNPACQPQPWGACYVVMHYKMAGNWVGMPNAFKDNVEKPRY